MNMRKSRNFFVLQDGVVVTPITKMAQNEEK